jgi:hypothetical protein
LIRGNNPQSLPPSESFAKIKGVVIENDYLSDCIQLKNNFSKNTVSFPSHLTKICCKKFENKKNSKKVCGIKKVITLDFQDSIFVTFLDVTFEPKIVFSTSQGQTVQP